MKYSINHLAENSGFVFFWGHQSTNDNRINKKCFSQWWNSPFVVENIVYKTAEHWMMAKKAALFNDKENLEKILDSETPNEAKQLGRKVKNYDEALWVSNRFQIVKEGNFHKFNQNEELKIFLLNTKQLVIVEASPVDPIWGIGMAIDHIDIHNPKKWKGLNLLGFALMEVRDELKRKK